MQVEVQVWWGSLVDADRRLLPLLSRTEQERVDSLDRPADRGRSLVGAALLRTVVATDLGCTPEQVAIDRTCAQCGGPHGRPRVLGPLPATRHTLPEVSVSHSGHLIAVALCRTHRVGVDVQRTADLTPGTDPWVWVAAESVVKAGGPAVGLGTVALDPPRHGYRAALTLQDAPGAHVSAQRWRPPCADQGQGH